MFDFITQTKKQTSWKEAKDAAENGRLNELFKSGDRIPVTLKNGEDIELDVTFDKNGKGYFVTHNCLQKRHVMNHQATNAGGWEACEMRRYLNEDVFALFPDELREVIAVTPVVQIVDGKRIVSEDHLFLLSRTQVFGPGWWSDREPEDTQLDIFKHERDRVKEWSDEGTWFWWLRSAMLKDWEPITASIIDHSGGTNAPWVDPTNCNAYLTPEEIKANADNAEVIYEEGANHLVISVYADRWHVEQVSGYTPDRGMFITECK